MILSDKKRENMCEAFNNLSKETRDTLMNATIELRTNNRNAWCSGVIFYSDATYAFVITAKHCLTTLAGDTTIRKTPVEYARDLQGKVSVHYGTTQLEVAPPTFANAADTVFGFLGSENDNGNKDTWDYDIIVLKCPDAKFRWFAKEHGIVTAANKGVYEGRLNSFREQNGILDTNTYNFAQLGFGSPSDEKVPSTRTYKNNSYKLQFKTSRPTARDCLEQAWPIEWVDKKGKAGAPAEQVCVLDSSDDDSTGGGDSGGPLFAIHKKSNDIYLVGVTLGADYFPVVSKPNYDDYGDNHIRNNIVTFWRRLFMAWKDSIT